MSALIWLGIVAVWGFVLIPMWLRHHDTSLEQRSAERFTTAMRVLSRRGFGRFGGRDMSVDGWNGGREPAAPHGTAGPPRHPSGAARTAVMRARRQRLAVLLVAVPASLVVALLLGGMWFVVHGIVDVGLVGYAGYLRQVARGEQRLRASRAARDRRIARERAAARLARPTYGPVAGPRPGYLAPAGPVSLPATRQRDAAASRGVQYIDILPTGVRAHVPLDVTRAETVDLSETIAAAQEAGLRDRHDAAAGYGETGYGETGYGETGYGETGYGAAQDDADGYDDADRYDDADGYDEVAEYEDADGYDEAAEYDEAGGDTDDPYRQDVGRRPARRSRPTTSKPGRVQVNPPGTHGGLTAQPARPAASADPGAEDAPDDLDELLKRHAVGE